MKKKNHILRCFVIMALVLTCSAFTSSGGEKERMIQRIPQITALKEAGVIGEKADGMLGFVKTSSSDKALIDAENKDRATVYAGIAKNQGVRVATVAERRASQILAQAPSGHWFQGKDGKWVQK